MLQIMSDNAPQVPEPNTKKRKLKETSLQLSTDRKHKKRAKDNIQDITKFDFRRMARRGGVKRLSVLIYEESRGVLKVFLENIIRDSVTIMQHSRRSTVMVKDVLYALKRQKRTLYF